jgi:hypothetical protein
MVAVQTISINCNSLPTQATSSNILIRLLCFLTLAVKQAETPLLMVEQVVIHLAGIRPKAIISDTLLGEGKHSQRTCNLTFSLNERSDKYVDSLQPNFEDK